MTVSIDSKEKLLYVATEGGWEKVIGFTCKFNDIEASLFATKDELIVSELTSGARIYSFLLNAIDMIECDTKVKFMALMRQKLEWLSYKMFDISGITPQRLNERAKKQLDSYSKEFGPMPPIEIVE